MLIRSPSHLIELIILLKVNTTVYLVFWVDEVIKEAEGLIGRVVAWCTGQTKLGVVTVGKAHRGHSSHVDKCCMVTACSQVFDPEEQKNGFDKGCIMQNY